MIRARSEVSLEEAYLTATDPLKAESLDGSAVAAALDHSSSAVQRML